MDVRRRKEFEAFNASIGLLCTDDGWNDDDDDR